MRFWRNVFILAAIGLLLSIIATIARAETYLPRGFGDTSRRERIMQTTDDLRVGDIRSSGSLSLDSFLDMPKTYIDADGNIDTSGTVRASAYYGSGAYLTDLETWPENVITVGAENCDYTTVQAAINAASSGDVVLVMPGTYTEQITGKAGVTVRGVSRDASIIRYDVQFSSPYGPEDSSISWGGSGTFALENLTAQNLVSHNPSGGTATVLYAYNAAVLRVRDCNITGSDNDTVSGWNTSQTYIERCNVETLNSQPDQYYFGGTSTLRLIACESVSAAIFYTVDNPTIYYRHNRFTSSNLGTSLSGTFYGQNNLYFSISGASHTFIESVSILGNSAITGSFYSNGTLYSKAARFGYSTFSDCLFYSKKDSSTYDVAFRITGSNNHTVPLKLQWNEPGSAIDTNLYRSAAATLKTDGTFEAASVTTTGAGSLGSLTVTGAAALNGGLTMDTSAFAVADSTGVVTLKGGATLDNNADANILNITETTTRITGILDITGNTTGQTLSLATQPTCELTTSGTLTLTTAGSGNDLYWGTETRDIGAMHSLVSNQTRVTIPSTGVYILTANITYIDTATAIVRLYVDGSFYAGQVCSNRGNVSAIKYLTAGQYLTVNVYHTKGSDASISAGYATFQVAKLY